MIKRIIDASVWFIFGLVVIILISILHAVGIIKVDDEYGF
jgi:hypothetical protein